MLEREYDEEKKNEKKNRYLLHIAHDKRDVTLCTTTKEEKKQNIVKVSWCVCLLYLHTYSHTLTRALVYNISITSIFQ